MFLCLLQTERTSTQSAGTSTGPTFSSGATGIPPEGSEPLFQMFDMGPDSVTEISAHVIPTERDMPPGSVHGKFFFVSINKLIAHVLAGSTEMDSSEHVSITCLFPHL